MFRFALSFHREKPVEGMPAFLCATILPFTYSIANGMLIGLLSYTVLKSCHKLGEIFTPERMKAQPPRECVAKTFKCKCVECAQEAISLVSSLTERQLSDTKLLGGANGTARAHSGGSVQSTPKRKPGRGEVFEDPMVSLECYQE
jgi:hypothetical protein